MSKSKSRTKPTPTENTLRYLCEAEVVTGLKSFAEAELNTRFGGLISVGQKDKAEEIPFYYDGDLPSLLSLNKALSVYLVQYYPIPRPLALLGHQHFQQLLRQISTVRSMHPRGAFQTFRIAAAGSDSSVFARVKSEIQQATGLILNEEDADLLIRVRRSDPAPQGWDVLVRLSPRPLATRAWRVCDFEGALNATIASAMVEMTDPHPEDRFFNPMCGSGTLLVERLRRGTAEVIGGCDADLLALRCADENLKAAGFNDQVDLFEMDAAHLQLPDSCLDAICADLPWGQLTGSHQENITLYPQALAEMARVAAPGARAALITHEIRLMEQTLANYAQMWSVKQTVRVFQGGLHPRIYVLERR